MKVGFIGLGMMGKGMAANLRRPGTSSSSMISAGRRRSRILANGAILGRQPQGGRRASEVVFTSLPVPADVEAVALGPNGLIEGMKPDALRHVDQFGVGGAQDQRLRREEPLYAGLRR